MVLNPTVAIEYCKEASLFNITQIVIKLHAHNFTFYNYNNGLNTHYNSCVKYGLPNIMICTTEGGVLVFQLEYDLY